MDYEFEAPQYVNFAMDEEDDHDVSKYFDVEHEYSIREPRVRLAPLDVLPKGLRSFATTSKPNQNTSLKSTQLSHGTPLTKAGSKPIEQSLSTPARRLTRSSLKGATNTLSPSAQYADCLTPGVKRLRPSTDNTPEGTPSKRLKSTPNAQTKSTPSGVIKALADIQLSPPRVIADLILQEAVVSLEQISRSAKRVQTPGIRRLSKVDGIEIELKPEKDHKMETRKDKKQQQVPLHLRSRSVPRAQPNRSLVTSPLKSKPEVKSRARARSVSKDRATSSTRAKNEQADRYVSLSDVLNKFQTKSPPRFKLKRNSPSKLTNGPLKPLRATVPTTTEIESRLRNRTSPQSTTTNRNTSKLNGTSGGVLKPLNTIEKKTPTVPAPFKLTEVRKKELTPSQPFKFTARPVPKSVLEPKKGTTPIKGKTPTKSSTPHKKMFTVVKEMNGQRFLKEEDLGYLCGTTVPPKKQLTELKPFSFEVREQERLARKNARLQEKIEAEIRGRPKFQANPLPAFAAARRRSPSPFSNKPSTPLVNGINGSHGAKNTKDDGVPSLKAPMAPTFRARAPVVLVKKPFEPVKPQRQLPLPSVTLNSETRAKEREEYDRKQAEKDAELQAILKRRKEEQERREQEATAKLRKDIVHKARPIPEVKAFQPQPSDKPLTDPKTPFCLKRSVLSSR